MMERLGLSVDEAQWRSEMQPVEENDALHLRKVSPSVVTGRAFV
jgi:hypothetical protein